MAESLVRQHETRDPYQICRELGYILIYTKLEGIRGYYQYVKRCHVIYLDENLVEDELRFVCAHELGHSLLHKGLNRIFMDTATYIVTSRYEKEADRFAVNLLYDDDVFEGMKNYSTSNIAEYLNVDEALVRYRMSHLEVESYNDY